MIAVFRQIVLCVTAASLFGAVLLSLVQQRAQKEIIRIAVGLLLLLSLLTPLRGLRLPQLSGLTDGMSAESADAEELYKQAVAEEFCRQTEEYVQQQAEQDGISCTVQVQAELRQEEMDIVSVTVRGADTEEQRETLSRLLTGQLGVEQERIQFAGEEQP